MSFRPWKFLSMFIVTTLVAFLFVNPAIARRGCCSHHGGVCGCDTTVGRQVCCDGTYSPSCTCYRAAPTLTPQPTPQPTKKPIILPTKTPQSSPLVLGISSSVEQTDEFIYNLGTISIVGILTILGYKLVKKFK